MKMEDEFMLGTLLAYLCFHIIVADESPAIPGSAWVSWRQTGSGCSGMQQGRL